MLFTHTGIKRAELVHIIIPSGAWIVKDELRSLKLVHYTKVAVEIQIAEGGHVYRMQRKKSAKQCALPRITVLKEEQNLASAIYTEARNKHQNVQ